MRIAQISPLYERVPPERYGGTERVVAYLTDELVRRGHEVTLFASGDSITRARLVPGSPSALRLASKIRDPLGYHLCMLDEVRARASEFDIIHSHADYMAFPFLTQCETPSVTTLHGRLDLEDLDPVYSRFPNVPLVSISDAQRKPFPKCNWVRTVHHGLPVTELRFRANPKQHLAFLGRVSVEKRADRAIEIAKRAGLPLRIAAKVDPTDQRYFETEIEPLLDHPLIEFIGEIGLEQKNDFLGDALALVFPIDWPEPFGLVMIEAMACGTPVIAFRGGSVEEIVKDGVSGFVVDDMDEAVAAVPRVASLDRRACRAWFEEKFNVTRMVDDYLDVYGRVVRGAGAMRAAS